MGTRLTPSRVRFGMSADRASRFTELGNHPTTVERIFMGSVSDNKLDRITTAMRAGRIPYLSVKPGTWSSAANGSIDAQMTRLADDLADLSAQYDTDVIVSLHHEPLQTPSNPTGEGGTSAAWKAMWLHLVPVMRRPGLFFYPTMNGWNFRPRGQGGTQGLTEAQKQEWMPPELRELWDGIGADYYRKPGQENDPAAVMGLAEQWAEANGVDSLIVGEFAAPEGEEQYLRAVQARVLVRDSMWRAVCYWNSDGTDAKFGLRPGTARMKAVQDIADAVIDYDTGADEPPPDPEPEPVPAATNLRAEVVDPTHIKLTWNGPSTVTPELWGPADNLIAVLPTGSHESTRGPLTPGTYTYRLRFELDGAYSPFAVFPVLVIDEPDPDPDPDPEDPRDVRIRELERLLADVRVVNEQLVVKVADYDHRLDTIEGIAARTTTG